MNRNLCLVQALIRDIENLIQNIVDIRVLGPLSLTFSSPVPIRRRRGGCLLALRAHVVSLVPVQVVHDAGVHEGSTDDTAGFLLNLTLAATFENLA